MWIRWLQNEFSIGHFNIGKTYKNGDFLPKQNTSGMLKQTIQPKKLVHDSG